MAIVEPIWSMSPTATTIRPSSIIAILRRVSVGIPDARDFSLLVASKGYGLAATAGNSSWRDRERVGIGVRNAGQAELFVDGGTGAVVGGQNVIGRILGVSVVADD